MISEPCTKTHLCNDREDISIVILATETIVRVKMFYRVKLREIEVAPCMYLHVSRLKF